MSYLLEHPLAGATYFLLALAAITLVARQRHLSIGCACFSLVAAFASGVVSIEGVIALAVFLCLCLWHFSLRRGGTILAFPGATVLSGLLVVAAALVIAAHTIIPGFHNVKIIDKMVMSEGGIPFSMYFNFDKVASAWILAVCGGFFPTAASVRGTAKEQAGAGRSLTIGAACLAGCIIVMIPVSMALGYIAFDPKIMPFFWIWALNNLVFVAFSEEILFRGMIQESLSAGFTRLGWSWAPYAALVISALLFGLPHVYGGWTYVWLATIAGLFYGTAFMKTRRVEASIAVHFLLNFVHALFFTYPALFK
ncbi:CPBP family intramembrane glutamic endopeptidase [Brucella sp. IR073]|uniref:CPBP family intramembrane glutamic endopeptidase n=1 Tax=unclassified Brucella TaxID=2632610 RepID=UPI003B981F25